MEISKVSMSSSGTGVTGITISPTKADAARAAQQREIDKIWRELNDKVVKLAQQEHKELQENLGIDDILHQVEAYRSKGDKPEKFAWFKSTLTKTLQVPCKQGPLPAHQTSPSLTRCSVSKMSAILSSAEFPRCLGLPRCATMP